MKNKIVGRIFVGIAIFVFCVSACSCVTSNNKSVEDNEKSSESSEKELSEDDAKDDKSKEEKTADKERYVHFVDVFGEEYEAKIDEKATKVIYDKSLFEMNDVMCYEDENYSSRVGVDVSHHQGYIDWNSVKNDGYDFAFIRLGYREYGREGEVNPDSEFDRNIVNAQNAGLDVGVYFFSQAVNVEEAEEEADFVIEHLSGYELELPVVYDPENILDDEARTDNVSGKQFTENTIAFCKRISEAGYEPMIYSNMLWEAFEFDMSKLTMYPFWYADYEKKPQTPYNFSFWQYTNEGYVDGISGVTDLNIQLVKKDVEGTGE